MELIRKRIRKILIQESKTIAYSAVCIEDPAEIAKIAEIAKKYVPENRGWRKPYDYHMTINLGSLPTALLKKGDLNQEVTLTVIGIGISGNAIALEVGGYYTKNDIPHITLAFQKNSLPSDSKVIKSWEPIEEFSVTGVIRQVAEGNIILKEHVQQPTLPQQQIDEIIEQGKLYYPNIKVLNGRVFVNYPQNKGSYAPGAFKKHLTELKLRKVMDLLKTKGISVKPSNTTVSIYIKLPHKEIRVSDHPNYHFNGSDVRVFWKEKVASMFNKVVDTMITVGTRTGRPLSESFDPDDNIMYHGTSSEKLESIMTSGLNSPYLTNDLNKAEYYAQEAVDEFGGETVILVINLPSMENLRVDYNELDEPVTLGDEEMEENISDAYQEYIQKYPESYDSELKTVSVDKHHYWMSLNTTNAVWYEGIIPPTNISEY